MSKAISFVKLSATLSLTECNDGFWLYDETCGMNLSMRAKTPNDAFVEALTYYQNRLQKTEHELNSLGDKVKAFVGQFITEWEEE